MLKNHDATPTVMAGVPTIHVFPAAHQDVDARDKPRHDECYRRSGGLL